MAAENKDIRDIYAAERRRGRRPIDEEERKRKTKDELRAALQKALREKDERAFLTALRRAGVKDGTDEFAKAFRVFRALIGQH